MKRKQPEAKRALVTEPLNVEVDVELLSRLEHYLADHRGQTKKAVVAAALDRYLPKYGKRGA